MASDQQRAANRLLEMSIRDLSSFVDSQVAEAGMSSIHKTFFGGGQAPRQDAAKAKERGTELEK
jgi:hypothetical protein